MAKQNSTLLLVNGIVLGAIALIQFAFDFVGYWTGSGPLARLCMAISTPSASPKPMAWQQSCHFCSSSAEMMVLLAGMLWPLACTSSLAPAT